MEHESFLLLVTGVEFCEVCNRCHAQLGVVVSSRDFHGTNTVSCAAAEALWQTLQSLGCTQPLAEPVPGQLHIPPSTELEGLAGQGTAAASAANFTWGLLPGHLLKHLGHWGRAPCSCFSLLAGCSFSDLWLFLLCSSIWKVSQGFLCVYQT